jgi:DNA-directed RNA polymerase subunit F
MTIGFTGYFQSDDLLPEQKLFAAILDNALMDGLGPENVKFKKKKVKWCDKRLRYVTQKRTKTILISNTERVRARRWFTDKGSNFEYFCDFLHLESENVRKIVNNIFEFCDTYGREKLHDLLRDLRTNKSIYLTNENAADKFKARNNKK